MKDVGMKDVNLVLNLICLFNDSKGRGDSRFRLNKVDFKLLPTGISYVSSADVAISGSGVSRIYYVRDDSKKSMYIRISLDGCDDVTFDFYKGMLDEAHDILEMWYLLRSTMFRWFGKLGIMNKHQLGDDYDNYVKYFKYDTLED